MRHRSTPRRRFRRHPSRTPINRPQRAASSGPRRDGPGGGAARWAAAQRRLLSWLAAGVALALSLAVRPGAAGAHEIPASVTLRAHVRAAGDSLVLLLRAPLTVFRDLDVPLRADGTLEPVPLARALPTEIATWLGPAFAISEDGRDLGAPRLLGWRVAGPAVPAFTSVAAGLARLGAADNAAAGSEGAWYRESAYVDVALAWPITSDAARFVATPAVARLGVRTETILAIERPGDEVRMLRLEGDPGPVALDPRWHVAARRFVADGVHHILGGIDHLLFLAALVLPVAGWRPLVAIVTAFTAGHSITLIAAALGMAPRVAWFPALVETLIAASLVYAAAENVLASPAALRRRWRLAFAFGLVHGFGFAFALGEALQFAGRHVLLSLASFNVGVELGQLGVLVVAVPALAWMRRRLPEDAMLGRRGLVIVGSALVAHTAWHWMVERWTALAAYEVAWPVLDAGFALASLRLGAVAALAGVVAIGVGALARRLRVDGDAAVARPAEATLGVHGAP